MRLGELAAALSHSHVTNVIGFLDDDAKLHGSQIRGLPVYNPTDIAMITRKRQVVGVMLALPQSAADVAVKYYSPCAGKI